MLKCAYLHRLYQTFIKKSKTVESDHHVPIPGNPELVKAILFELGHTKEATSKVSIEPRSWLLIF